MSKLEMAIEPIKYTKEQREIVTQLMQDVAGYSISLDVHGVRREGTINDSYCYTGHIIGKMLTIIESVIEDKERREATKSIVKQMINDEKQTFIRQLSRQYKEY